MSLTATTLKSGALHCTPRATKDEAHKILRPFLIPTPDLLAHSKPAADSGEISMIFRADARHKVFLASEQEINRAILAKFKNPAVLRDEIFRTRKDGSAFKVAFMHYAFDRRRVMAETPAAHIANQAPLVAPATEMNRGLRDLDVHQSPFWTAVNNEMAQKTLQLFGVKLNDLLTDSEPIRPWTKASLSLAAEFEHKVDPSQTGYRGISQARVQELAEVAQKSWGLEVSVPELCAALTDLAIPSQPDSTKVSGEYLKAIENACSAATSFSKQISANGEFPETKAAAKDIDAIVQALGLEQAFTIKKEHLAMLEGLGDVGQGNQLAQKGLELAQTLGDITTKLSTEKERILTKKTTEALNDLFGDAPLSENPSLDAALMASVAVAGARLGTARGATFESVREKSLADLKANYSDPTIFSQGLGNLIINGSDISQERTFWAAVALHAVDLAVTPCVGAEISRIQNTPPQRKAEIS